MGGNKRKNYSQDFISVSQDLHVTEDHTKLTNVVIIENELSVAVSRST